MSSLTEEELINILPKDGPTVQEVKKYSKKYNDEFIVIKCGGSVLVDSKLFKIFIEDVAVLKKLGFNPIIMGITMFIQQKLNPTPPDPIQAKIFMFFPVFLTVILAPFPAGLVIYWSFNNIFTMIQQYIVQRKMTIKTT